MPDSEHLGCNNFWTQFGHQIAMIEMLFTVGCLETFKAFVGDDGLIFMLAATRSKKTMFEERQKQPMY